MPPPSDSELATKPVPDSSEDTGIGARPLPVFGIIGLLTYFIALAAILLCVLVALWPTPTPSGKPPPTDTEQHSNASPAATASATNAAPTAIVSSTAKLPAQQRGEGSDCDCHVFKIFGHELEIADEVRLLMLVICAGALGSLVHGLRSIYWYIGNRNLIWSWVPKYLLLPVSGAILSVIFYFVFRGGLFSPRAGFE